MLKTILSFLIIGTLNLNTPTVVGLSGMTPSISVSPIPTKIGESLAPDGEELRTSACILLVSQPLARYPRLFDIRSCLPPIGEYLTTRVQIIIAEGVLLLALRDPRQIREGEHRLETASLAVQLDLLIALLRLSHQVMHLDMLMSPLRKESALKPLLTEHPNLLQSEIVISLSPRVEPQGAEGPEA